MVKDRWGKYSLGFTPAIGKKAEKSIRDEMRSWKMHLMAGRGIEDLSRTFNPRLRGWINYYGAFRPSALLRICLMFQKILVKWAKRKYKGLRTSWGRAWAFIQAISLKQPYLFAHWERGWCLTGTV